MDPNVPKLRWAISSRSRRNHQSPPVDGFAITTPQKRHPVTRCHANEGTRVPSCTPTNEGQPDNTQRTKRAKNSAAAHVQNNITAQSSVAKNSSAVRPSLYLSPSIHMKWTSGLVALIRTCLSFRRFIPHLWDTTAAVSSCASEVPRGYHWYCSINKTMFTTSDSTEIVATGTAVQVVGL
jgi:hypothetical protein